MRSRSRTVVVGAAALGVTCIAGTVGSASGLAATADHSVSVINATGKTVAEFTTAKCRRHKDGAFTAISDSARGGYTLFVTIERFDGFDSYDLEQAANAPVYASVHRNRPRPHGVTYSNLNVPPFSSFGFGQVVFRNHGKLMGVGYSPAYAKGGHDAVTFTGVVRCTYPKRKR